MSDEKITLESIDIDQFSNAAFVQIGDSANTNGVVFKNNENFTVICANSNGGTLHFIPNLKKDAFLDFSNKKFILINKEDSDNEIQKLNNELAKVKEALLMAQKSFSDTIEEVKKIFTSKINELEQKQARIVYAQYIEKNCSNTHGSEITTDLVTFKYTNKTATKKNLVFTLSAAGAGANDDQFFDFGHERNQTNLPRMKNRFVLYRKEGVSGSFKRIGGVMAEAHSMSSGPLIISSPFCLSFSDINIVANVEYEYKLSYLKEKEYRSTFNAKINCAVLEVPVEIL
ncbi:MAG: hypothetical protein HQK52_19540 [Oligoflexia bacterium]|nr:hypothetical protein [Oligoflexia bacterium]